MTLPMVGDLCKECMSGWWRKQGRGGEHSKAVVVIVMAVLRDLSCKMTSERARIRQPVPIFAIRHAAEYPSVPGAERGRPVARATRPFRRQAPTALRAEIGATVSSSSYVNAAETSVLH